MRREADVAHTSHTTPGAHPLRALVIGSGWAGEGHTLALRAAGVEVVALVGRTPEPTCARARTLGIDTVRFDWRAALQEFRPDIVSIATAAAPHAEMAIEAATAGYHVVCEKPLAVDPVQARAMLEAVERAMVKHAYGATGGYYPAFLHTQALLTGGLIGSVRLVEYHVYVPPVVYLAPYSWSNQLSQGGGVLNNLFPHLLQQLLMMTGGTVAGAAGYTWGHRTTAPVGPAIHDFRELFGAIMTPEQAAAAEQRPFDAEWNATALLQLRMPGDAITNVLVQLAVAATPVSSSALTFYGDAGTLYLNGSFWADAAIQHFDPQRGERVDIPIPQAVVERLPPIEDHNQRQWNQFFLEFVADVRGTGGTIYPTFYDGWVAAEVIDIVRRGSLTALPGAPAVAR